MCYSVLQCVAVCCSVLVLQHIAATACKMHKCCSVSQCVAVRCRVLQCVAMYCSALMGVTHTHLERDRFWEDTPREAQV